MQKIHSVKNLLQKRKSAFSLVEILIAIIIVTCAVLPLLTLSQSNRSTSTFSERYLIALSQGKRISSTMESMGYSQFSGPSNPLFETNSQIKQISDEYGPIPYLNFHKKKLSNYKASISSDIKEKGFAVLKTKVNWTVPGESKRMKEHECVIETFIIDRQNNGGYKMELQ